MNDAEFDRALGVWEDNQLNAHLAEEEEWDFAHDQAVEIVGDMELSEVREWWADGGPTNIEDLRDAMVRRVTQQIVEGKWENE
jgi:hypothetical protein